MLASMTRWWLGTKVALMLVLALIASCGGGRDPNSSDQAGARMERASQQLQGSWTLTSAQPEVPLEPMLQTLLQAQIGRMVIRFDGQNMRAQGTGVNFTRRYKIVSAFGNRLEVVIFDELGAQHRAGGEFQGDTLAFMGHTSPWRGRGTLQRRH